MKAAIVLAFAILVSGCINTPQDSETFTIISATDYNQDLCGGTSFSNEENGYNSGVILIPVDAMTGLKLNETHSFAQAGNVGTTISFTESYTCFDGIRSPVNFSVYAKGHAPSRFFVQMPPDKQVKIEVPMKKSCAEKLHQAPPPDFMDMASKNFGITQGFILDCAESSPERGGYKKAAGSVGESPFEMFYHTGWCSPAGGDCGYEICFRTQDEGLLEDTKGFICSKIGNATVTEKCMSGEFDSQDAISFAIASNPGSVSIYKTDSACLEK